MLKYTDLGDNDARLQFNQDFAIFLDEYAILIDDFNLLIVRTLPMRDQPNDAIADKLLIFLSRIAIDDFGDILLLLSNGRPYAALKILRGMYERVVTAQYLCMHPEKTTAFLDDGVVRWHKLLSRNHSLFKEIAPRETLDLLEEKIAKSKELYDAIVSRRKESICRRCGQAINYDSSLPTLSDMADENEMTQQLYPYCYLEATYHSHATQYCNDIRFSFDDDVINMKDTPVREVRTLLSISHALLLHVASMLCERFSPESKERIQHRDEVFRTIWGLPETARHGT